MLPPFLTSAKCPSINCALWSNMLLNAILGFFSNVLASVASNMLTRIHPLILLAVGLVAGVWITYMVMRNPSTKTALTEEATGSVVGDVVAGVVL